MEKKVIHRSLNPNLIYINSNDPTRISVKITEFGTLAYMDPENMLCGKIAPEIFTAPELKSNIYNEKVICGVLGHPLLAIL